jgi:hypothetical protein
MSPRALPRRWPRAAALAALLATAPLLAGCRLHADAEQPQLRAPSFVLVDARGQSFDLQAALARGPVVLAFYRGWW